MTRRLALPDSIIASALLQASGVALYVFGVASFFVNAPTLFSGAPEHTVLIPTMMLLLFVLSAGTTGSLVLGRSLVWCFERRYRDAGWLLAATLAFLLLFVALSAFLLAH